jgi:hypothetical protein
MDANSVTSIICSTSWPSLREEPVALALLLAALGNSFGAEPAKVSADEALKRLIQGNARFVAGHMAHVAPEHVASARRARATRVTLLITFALDNA